MYVTNTSNNYNHVATKTPEVFVTKSKSRLKIYQHKNIFLKDGDEFEIEIFNPNSKSVMVKIYINNTIISTNGLVIKPGQRVFLERFIDTNNKFRFATYEVNGENKEVTEAIAHNGEIRVEFYDEYIPVNYLSNYTYYNSGSIRTLNLTSTARTNIGGLNGNILFSGNVNEPIGSTFTSSSNSTSGTYKAFKEDTQEFLGNKEHKKTKLETGTIDKGDKSEQVFGTSYQTFNTWSFATKEFKILPISQQLVEADSIRNYCSGCGIRVRNSDWKFCPKCGSKI